MTEAVSIQLCNQYEIKKYKLASTKEWERRSLYDCQATYVYIFRVLKLLVQLEI